MNRRNGAMLKTKYDVLVRNGKDRFVLVPERDYEALRERLQDDADFRAIEASKKRNAGAKLIPHEQVMREFGLSSRGKKRKR
jgi:PHD/YefM family antitoxin component YafN of YafNO toxin-antitoxin module